MGHREAMLLLSAAPALPVAVEGNSTLSIRDDPMFFINGKQKQFWLPTGKPTVMLHWADGKNRFVLKGTTFGHGGTQWFRDFSLVVDHEMVISVSIADLLQDESDEESSKPCVSGTVCTLDVKVDGERLNTLRQRVHSGPVSAEITALANHTIGKKTAESVEIDAPGFSVAFSSTAANRYDDLPREQRWAHLNLKMKRDLPQSASGFMAELAELRPMSDATKKLLIKPDPEEWEERREAAQKAREDLQQARDAEKDKLKQQREDEHERMRQAMRERLKQKTDQKQELKQQKEELEARAKAEREERQKKELAQKEELKEKAAAQKEAQKRPQSPDGEDSLTWAEALEAHKEALEAHKAEADPTAVDPGALIA